VTPVLVHIGYHKTATKWLRGGLFCNDAAGYRWLGKAPASPAVNNLIFARPLDFDAAAIRGEFEPLFADAEAAGLLPVVCFGRLSGHPFSGGYDSKLIADRLKDVLPEARILIVIREQRSMIVSTYKQYVKGGGVCTLEHFLEPATERGWRVPSFDYRHFEYDRLIAHYYRLYGKESVLVLPYERLVADARDFVATIARFAGRPVPQEVLDGIVGARRTNKADSALAVAVSRPLNRFGPHSELNPMPLPPSERMFNLALRIRKKWDPQRSRLTRAPAARSEERLRRAVKEAVGERYVASNRITSELIGVDLAEYGWML